MSDRRQLALNLFIYPGGHHEAAWRYRGSSTARVLDITYYQELAQRAEACKLDAIFFADGPALADNVRYAQRFRFEPITWLSAIAAVTSRIGLIATASTTYTEPYNLARLFASLDHLSGGRTGWNIVTTSVPQAAQNFGLPEHPPHGERYERAREYLDVITKLWDSWEDDALVNDPVSGIFADTSKIHTIDHVGKHLRVRGPREQQQQCERQQSVSNDVLHRESDHFVKCSRAHSPSESVARKCNPYDAAACFSSSVSVVKNPLSNNSPCSRNAET